MTMPPLFDDRQFYRNLFTLAIPIMLQNLAHTLVSTLATVTVGRLGTVEVAAVGLGNQIFFLYHVFLYGICSGGAIFTAQFWGNKDIAGIRKNMGFCITLNLVTATIFTLATLLIPEKLIGVYSRDQELIKAGAAYLRAFSPSFAPYAISMVFTLTLRSVEKVRLAIVATVAAVSLNAFLNFTFIFGRGPFPAMGIQGVALATVISRLVEAAILVSVTYSRKYVPAGTLRELFSFDRHYARHCLRISLPVIIQEIIWSLGVTTQNIIFGRTDTNAIAAFTITAQASQLTWVLFVGLANGVAVLIGKKIGERDENTARDYASRIVRFAPILSLGAAFVLFPLSRLLPSIFNLTPQALLTASSMFVILGCSYPFRAFNICMIVGVCRAGGDTIFCAFYDIVIMWLVALPLAALAAFKLGAPAWAIYIIILMDEPLKALLGIWRFRSGKWLHNIIGGLR